MPLEDAARWCDAWEVEAAMRELVRDANYWTVGSAWIAEQRAMRRSPDTGQDAER